MPPIESLVLGFVAGFLATLIFHQTLWFVFNQIGLIPPERTAWLLDAVPPFGAALVMSKAFWGGLVLTFILLRQEGPAYWIAWILVGAVGLTAVAVFVVAPLKAQPIPSLWPRFAIGMTLNGAWGSGTAWLLRIFGAGRPE